MAYNFSSVIPPGFPLSSNAVGRLTPPFERKVLENPVLSLPLHIFFLQRIQAEVLRGFASEQFSFQVVSFPLI